MRRSVAALALLLAAPAAAQTAPRATPAPLREQVAYLASDAMRGREAGTPEYDRAADYVARQMAAAGLSPAGTDGWFQPVALVSARTLPGSTLAVTRGRRSVPLVPGTDWALRNEGRAPRVQVSAPMVFAGYGIADAGSGRDDYAGLDMRGKVAVVLTGAPDTYVSDQRAHLGNRATKAQVAARAGAVGILFVQTPESEASFPFARAVRYYAQPTMTWATPDGRPSVAADATPMLGNVSLAGAARLFAGTPVRWRGVLADLKAKRSPKGAALGTAIAADLRSDIASVRSPNVVGRLEGSDPALRGEHVVLTAHLDHVGVGEPDARGDTIYNGALDNAIGVGAMLQAARTIVAGPRPKRSVLFVAVTAEEKGLIGSDYYAHNPTVPAASIVANVNLDMPILTYRFVDLVALGADRSTIGPLVARAAAAEGLRLVPDPMPEEGNFTRTDHYSFVRRGIPAVSLDLGPGGPGAAATKDFLDNHYHEPSDDLNLPIDWTAADTFVRVNVGIVRALADAAERPRWNRGDFFGTTFGGPMAQ